MVEVNTEVHLDANCKWAINLAGHRNLLLNKHGDRKMAGGWTLNKIMFDKEGFAIAATIAQIVYVVVLHPLVRDLKITE